MKPAVLADRLTADQNPPHVSQSGPSAAAEPTPAEIERAARSLRDGRLVAFPTETVYGLGADATNPQAVASIFRAKGRPVDHPVIVHLADPVDAGAWTAKLPASTEQALESLAARFWPGPLTLILPRAERVSDVVTGGQRSVGLRCPAHPVAQALLRSFSDIVRGEAGNAAAQPMSGIAAPSANRFGRISPTSAQHVRDEFPDQAGKSLTILDGGDCPIGIESTIVDLSRHESAGAVLLRPGSITAAMLAEVLGDLPRRSDQTTPRASGTLAAHYAPRTPLFLVSRSALEDDVAKEVAVWTRTCALRSSRWLRAPADAAAYARVLYDVLRRLDASGASAILVEAPPDEPEWAGINDRLRRAAIGSRPSTPLRDRSDSIYSISQTKRQ